jgi:hypothetical protein
MHIICASCFATTIPGDTAELMTCTEVSYYHARSGGDDTATLLRCDYCHRAVRLDGYQRTLYGRSQHSAH